MKYVVVYRSSGIVAFSTTKRAFAVDWMADNDTCPRTGKSLGLFEIKRSKK
jgi:hypothetical protein